MILPQEYLKIMEIVGSDCMKLDCLPENTGLYNQQNEHDACGIGVIVNIDGKKSHQVIKDSMHILNNLDHRGGTGAEDNTGDGAGILTQIPHKFYKSQNLGFEIGDEGDYAVAFLFLSQNEEEKELGIKVFTDTLAKTGLTLLGFRKVPVCPYGLGETAVSAMPYMTQAFVKRSSEIKKGADFERVLFRARRLIEKEAHKFNVPKFYFTSFSSRTIVYKGMLKSTQIRDFYLDLKNQNYESSLALVHSRFSTNTFPSWERAHPNRFMIHNGEINTIKGNVDLIKGREANFTSLVYSNIDDVLPVIEKPSSDSAMFDNTLEFLYMNGRSLEEALMMMIPKPWDKDPTMTKEQKDFYQFNALLMEPWDGPASIVSTDGEVVVASLDRNGLRPSRYYLTSDNYLILASETGAIDIPEEKIIAKRRLEPGKLLLVDTKLGKVLDDKDIQARVFKLRPYSTWLKSLMNLDEVKPLDYKENYFEGSDLLLHQRSLGYKYDTIDLGIIPMAENHEEALVAMGTDIPLAVLSNNKEPMYKYFKQLFAQVTNPPIDSIRENIVISTLVYLCGEGNLLSPSNINARRVVVSSPIINSHQMASIRRLNEYNYNYRVIDITFEFEKESLKKALDRIFKEVNKALDDKIQLLVLSDKAINEKKAAIPMLLAISAVHQHLVKINKRTLVSLIAEVGDAREIHHYACLLGFGANLIYPYLVYDTIADLVKKGYITKSYDVAVDNYIKAANKGIVKIITKMGISTVQAYDCARIFEIIGLNDSVTDKYFAGMHSKIGGISLEDISDNVVAIHKEAYENYAEALDSNGSHYLRNGKEVHLYNPLTIYKLQYAVKNDAYSVYKEFAKDIDSMNNNIRNLMDFEETHSISIDEVEPVSEIVKRFKTGAMSYGSISEEAHECMAIAMNRIGGKSNTGEGGENEGRDILLPNGDSKLSAIKQVASGRFGVTMEYLVKSKEIQIKIAQGAKPGEGGQLPGKKVYPWVAKARHSTPGVSLISPPPHHDIYSIEDLAQLIYDLKNANEDVLISVKLVSEDGVGTVASGVAKAGANVILISGYDGGTGASPRTSISNAGMPWEIGLADAHQTLIMNDLRTRVKLEVDGKLLTGKDLAIAILLGADEFGFATAPLISMGCVMMRVCNLDTCPVGVATQNEELRKRFKGKPEYVINFMYMIAENLREYMAKLGFRTINEMIGRSDLLKIKNNELVKDRKVTLDKILNNKYVINKTAVHFEHIKESGLDKTMDHLVVLPLVEKTLKDKSKTVMDLEIKNVNRTFGTILSSKVTRLYGKDGLADDTITINTYGHAGNSYGAFVTHGITLNIIGDANDYLAKGLCGGHISVRSSEKSNLKSNENIIAGNVILYGATSGNVYIDGVVGERFAVRNSGAKALVIGCGNHGCEYMTGGVAVVLDKVGRNFAAGMSGGKAYIYKSDENISNINTDLVDVIELDDSDYKELMDMILEHIKLTNSKFAKELLKTVTKDSFVKIMPRDYKMILELKNKYLHQGLSDEDATLKAFYEKTR